MTKQIWIFQSVLALTAVIMFCGCDTKKEIIEDATTPISTSKPASKEIIDIEAAVFSAAGTQSSAPAQVPFGSGTTAAAPAAFNFGSGTTAAAPASFSFGSGTTAAAPAAFSFGSGTTAAAPAAFSFPAPEKKKESTDFSFSFDSSTTGNATAPVKVKVIEDQPDQKKSESPKKGADKKGAFLPHLNVLVGCFFFS